MEPGSAMALDRWRTRQVLFADFVAGLPGIGWNTFDYILRRDLPYRGCLMLFKVDSTNEDFMEKVFGRRLKGDRTQS